MLSTTTWIIILFFLIIAKHVFIQPFEDKKVYSVYAARDEVALAAIDGKIEQDSKIYRFGINYLNFWIFYARNDYDFAIVLDNIFGLEPEHVEAVQRKIDEELRQNVVAHNAMKKTKPFVLWVIGVKGFIFTNIFLGTVVLLLTLLLWMAEKCIAICDIGHTTALKITNYLEESRRIQNEYDKSKKMLYRRMI